MKLSHGRFAKTLEHCQITLQHSGPRTICIIEVWNAARSTWQHWGPQMLRSGMLPGRPGSIPDLNNTNCARSRMLPCYLAVFQTSTFEVPNAARSTWQHSRPQ